MAKMNKKSDGICSCLYILKSKNQIKTGNEKVCADGLYNFYAIWIEKQPGKQRMATMAIIKRLIG